jgi:NADPH:quinone reductase
MGTVLTMISSQFSFRRKDHDMKAVVYNQNGGPEVLSYEDVPDPKAGAGQVVVDLKASGVNFIDIYYRKGLYPAQLPFIPGDEGAGIVTEVGEGVTDLKVGDTVGYVFGGKSYAEKVAIPSERAIKLPAGIDMQQAAAVLLQGMTAHFLCNTTYPLKPGDKALIHAGAGGVGQLLIQMAKKMGATVFTTVSTDAKAELAKEAGADTVINYTKNNFEEAIKEATGGKGIQVAFDSVGKDTWEQSLNCLAPRGYLVMFGWASGVAPPIDPRLLQSKGSLFMTRPTLGHYLLDRAELDWRSGEVLSAVASGELKVRIHKAFPLAEAADAQRDLEGRVSTGKVMLTP